MAVVKNLMVRAGADFSALKKESEKAQKTLQSFKTSISSIMSGIKVTLASLAIGKVIKDSVKSAMEIEAALQQIKRIMGESSNQFLKWANDTAIAFGMSKAEALKYGSVYGNLISTFAKSTGETMKYTEDLLKSSAIIASSTGRSMEDVMDRIRSGLLGNTEAIEDLGVNVNVAMLESTEAFQKFANGKSWQQLNFQTQQQIRLMAILEQTYKKYGDSVAENTAYKQQVFLAQLKNIQLSLGQAFLPIYNVILPALTSLASKLAYVMNIVAQFSQALFGKATKQAKAQVQSTNKQAAAVDGLGEAYKGAGKEAKKEKGFLAGFDEITSVSNDSGGSSGGGGGTGAGQEASAMSDGLSGIGTEAPEVSSKVQEMANKVRAAFKSVAQTISDNKVVITSALSGIIAGFAVFKVISEWDKIVKAFTLTMKALSVAMSGISVPALAIGAIVALLIANIVYLWQTNEGFRNSVIEIWTSIKDFLTKVVTDTWNIIKGIWDKYGAELINNLVGYMKAIQDIILVAWDSVIKPIISGALEMLSWLWDKHIKNLVTLIGEFVMKLTNAALLIWSKFIAPIVKSFVEDFGPVIVTVISYTLSKFGSWLASMADVFAGLFRMLNGVIDFVMGVFTGNWGKAWNGVKEVFKGVFDSLYGIVKYPLNLIIDAINSVIRGLNSLKINIPAIPGITQGSSIGFNIPRIPKLAQGGYIGANSPVLAMVGDNRHEGEIVATESKIYEQTYKAIKDAMGSNSGDKKLVLNINAGNSTIARIVIDSLTEYARQHGELPIPI